MRSNNSLRKYVPYLLLFLLFEAVAVTLRLTKDNLFYLLNFSYIGGCLALGTALFLAGNVLYYIAGITLAFIFKDNRAFCKYLCPITVFLKPMSYFSLLRVHCDEDKCIHCGKCLRICPMNVEANRESRKRKNGTECFATSVRKRALQKRCIRPHSTQIPPPGEMLFLPALPYAQSIFATGGVPNEPDSHRRLYRA